MRSLLLLGALLQSAAAAPFPGCKGGTLEGCPGTQNCTVHYLEQNIDHFNWAAPLGDSAKTTYKQRFFINDQWWDRANHGPVFFYFGNEDNVELYVNHTGLMWESAEAFGALLVFGEHRYYGESMPYAPGTVDCMNFLTTEQAMADFAYLIDHLRLKLGAEHSAFIGFGGSYGGMLGSWFRVHYPNAIDGVIAASAPIWSFVGLDPPYDFNAFNEAVTFDASSAGGASDSCKSNLKAAWARILSAGKSDAGRRLLASTFRTCSALRPPTAQVDDAMSIVEWASSPWGTMAMGNYPYASSCECHGIPTRAPQEEALLCLLPCFVPVTNCLKTEGRMRMNPVSLPDLMHGESLLPAWPVRAACSHLAQVDAATDSDVKLFAAVREAAATYHNNTGALKCFNITRQHVEAAAAPRRFMTSPPRYHPGYRPERAPAASRSDYSCRGNWDFQWCTEMTQPFTQGTPNDMFYCPPAANCSAWRVDDAQCQRDWGVTPRPEWARVALGGKRIEDASNIVFSNGLQDPWHPGGVLRNLSASVRAIVIPNGAHHIDLMFTDEADAGYPDIAWARGFERAEMKKWVGEHRRKRLTSQQQADKEL